MDAAATKKSSIVKHLRGWTVTIRNDGFIQAFDLTVMENFSALTLLVGRQEGPVKN